MDLSPSGIGLALLRNRHTARAPIHLYRWGLGAALALVGLVRLLDWAIPGDVWFVYAGLGTIFVILGVALWSRREPSS